MTTLLVVRHTPTAGTRALADAVVAGAHDDAIEGVQVRALAPDATDADDLTGADGVVVLGPANFGYMSGLVKDLFDRTFLQVGGALGDDGAGAPAASGRLPYALVVHGRYDTEGAVRSIQSIVQALPWRQAAEPLQVLGDVDDDHLAAAYEVGATLAALLSDG